MPVTTPSASASREALKDFLKQAAPYGYKGFATQGYLPVDERRDKLTSAEEDAIRDGQSNWFPTIWQTGATPIPGMMASPLKQALLVGGGAGLLGGALGGGMGFNATHLPVDGLTGAALGALLAGVPAGALAYFARNARNEDLVEAMRRLPPNARRRDYLSDPTVQAEMDREAQRLSAGRIASAIGGIGALSKYGSHTKSAEATMIKRAVLKEALVKQALQGGKLLGWGLNKVKQPVMDVLGRLARGVRAHPVQAGAYAVGAVPAGYLAYKGAQGVANWALGPKQELPAPDAHWYDGAVNWLGDNPMASAGIGAGLGVGLAGLYNSTKEEEDRSYLPYLLGGGLGAAAGYFGPQYMRT